MLSGPSRSRDPDVLEVRSRVDLLGVSSLPPPIGIARIHTGQAAASVSHHPPRHGEPVLGHDISASRKPGKTCQPTVTWPVSPSPHAITFRQPPFSDRAGHPDFFRPKGPGTFQTAAVVSLPFGACNLFLHSTPSSTLFILEQTPAPTLPWSSTPFPADRYSTRPDTCV